MNDTLYNNKGQDHFDVESSSRNLHFVSDASDDDDENTFSSSSTTFISDLSNSCNDTDSVLPERISSIRSFFEPSKANKAEHKSLLEATVARENKYKNHNKILMNDLEKEKLAMMALWKEEFEAERRASFWQYRIQRQITESIAVVTRHSKMLLIEAELCIGNLPLTIGAIALSWVMLGIVWFKFTEEALPSCNPVSFWSPHCSLREFPGCYNCGLDNSYYYDVAHNFRYGCKIFAMILISGVLAKCVLAWKIVQDDLSNPVTSTPFGAIAMGANLVLSSYHGVLGQTLATGCSFAQLGLYLWFLCMAIKHRMLPDPSWSPNTISGLCVAATSVWSHAPGLSFGLMSLGGASFAFYFPISILRVFFNKKISANVCWIQVSAPSSILSAIASVAQLPYAKDPQLGFDENGFDPLEQQQGKSFMPLFHALFIISLAGGLSSIHGLITRWDSFRKIEFNPGHAAFCFPILCHVNAVHTYWYMVNSFSAISEKRLLKRALFSYWIFVLILGTFTTLIVTAMYLYHLPKWTRPSVILDRESPPHPQESFMSEVLDSGEFMIQSLISPTLLQANETGVLVKVRRDSGSNRSAYIRTCLMTSIGFEPKLSPSEMIHEKEELLQWVASQKPQPRHSRMVSDSYLQADKVIYGTFECERERQNIIHKRCMTQL